MVISRTPFRISFFGGGTDHPRWYLRHGGEVLATSIDKFCYLTCRYLPPFFEHRFRVVYSKIENTQTIDEIMHPAARAILKYCGIDRGVEIHHDGDLPARSGMGTSSSFTVGLLNALHRLRGERIDKRGLARESIDIEQEILKETVGSQDQVSAAYGGFNHIVFSPGGEIAVRGVDISKERSAELNASLMLFYTGIKRTASAVSESYVPSLESKQNALDSMRDLVAESLAVLKGTGDLAVFGRLLDEGWRIKRSLSPQVSNAVVDRLYGAAREAGALGGKLTGAGGGGFLLLFVPPGRQRALRERFRDLIRVPFKFDFSGSQIIFFDPENDYSSEESYWNGRTKPTFFEADTLPGGTT